MITGKKLVVYELNEVPKRVLEDFVERHPRSTIARVVGRSRRFQTFAEDAGILSPWITWPTVHRGVSNEKHCISDFGQDLSEVNAEFPGYTEILARNGIRVGVFGSLHTYPLPEDLSGYSFYVPDTFANGPECFPEQLSAFQEFNLRMVDASGRNVSRSVLVGPAARFLAKAPQLGLRVPTMGRLAGQLLSERVNAARAGRRRTSQMQIAFDLFWRQLNERQPDFASFFTNHVASSMHRYWPAKFRQDFTQANLADEWYRLYGDEIDFAMREADRQLADVVRFVESKPGYALIVTTSMGQAAVDSSTVVLSQLYITDIPRFMSACGVASGGWARHRAMLPRYVFRISEAFAGDFASAAKTLTVNGKPIPVAELGNNIVQLKLGNENLANDDTVITLRGQSRRPQDLGMDNVAIQDETGSYAYHIPQGVMLVYQPDAPHQSGGWEEASTRDIAPLVLNNFGVQRPAYMTRGIH
jgi:hypothetical protein